MVVRYPHVVEVQLTGIKSSPTDTAHLWSQSEAGGALLDDEAPEFRSPVVGGLRAGKECHPERHVGPGIGDECLGTVDQPTAVLPFGPGADGAGVGTRIRLGQPEGAEYPSLGQGPQPAFALAVVAEQ